MPWMSVKIVYWSPSLTSPMATPDTGRLIGTPAFIKESVLPQTLPMELEPFDSKTSDTRRMV